MMKVLFGNNEASSDNDNEDEDESVVDLEVADDSDDDDELAAKGIRTAEDLNRLINPDDLYQNEFGYSFIVAFRGRTTGRKLKRDVCKLGLLQFVCGVAFLCICQTINDIYAISHFLHKTATTTPIITLEWMLGIICVVISVPTLFTVRHWDSLATNRGIMCCVMKFYYCICLATFIMALWCLCAVFVGFKHVNWRTHPDSDVLLPFYIKNIVFLLPFLLMEFLYGMDVWYLCDEVELGGTIAEPTDSSAKKGKGKNKKANNGPLLDLSNVSVQDSCVLVIALPLAGILQLADLLRALSAMLMRIFCGADAEGKAVRCLRKVATILGVIGGNRGHSGSDEEADDEERQINRRKKKKSFCYRIARTLWKCCTCQRRKRPYAAAAEQADEGDNKLGQRLAALRNKRQSDEEQLHLKRDEEDLLTQQQKREQDEQQQDREREREREEQKRKEAQAKAEAQAEQQKHKEKDLQHEGEEQEKAQEEAKHKPKTLTVTQFKAMWSSLEAAGSFQCGLKELPTMHKLSEHLKKQGFHIVFASQNTDSKLLSPASALALPIPSSSASTEALSVSTAATTKIDIEIGICNIRSGEREEGEGELIFLARFIVSMGCFNAVMKCSQPKEVPNFVKKFLLAKVLKIDASKQTK